ncbi:hypothetical protein GA0061102_1004119 [Rhizobium miluonense]|uniref:Uncharacterized protein n=1 Tax=Rhizobium miluonense TaxID=411945 RepID=A0A1C3UKZ0_9HYPH|nr:hypothetical protein GA0061102_1004119 [Rhizobium miluonense]
MRIVRPYDDMTRSFPVEWRCIEESLWGPICLIANRFAHSCISHSR